MIRPGVPADAQALWDIEVAAGELFREVGMAEIAEHQPRPAEGLVEYVLDGRCWVAEDDGKPVGYLLVDVIDGNAHIEQVSVHPDHQGHGIGKALIGQADDWARDRSIPLVTLITFPRRAVEWAAVPASRVPGYERRRDRSRTPSPCRT